MTFHIRTLEFMTYIYRNLFFLTIIYKNHIFLTDIYKTLKASNTKLNKPKAGDFLFKML